MKDEVQVQKSTQSVRLLAKGKVHEFERGLTFEIGTKSKHLAVLKTEDGAIRTEKALHILVENYLDSTNAKRSMSSDQAYILCIDLLEDYPHESLEDFGLMFKMVRKGKFSEAYGTIDQAQIYKWMSEYLENKAIDRENRFKMNPVEARSNEVVESAGLKKLVDAYSIEKKERVIIKGDRMTMEKQNEALREFIEGCELNYGDVKTLESLKKDLKNNDVLGNEHYDELIKLIDKKLEL